MQYVPMKKGPKTSKHATGARVLTNDEYTKRIFEREEKESRKAEREQKRRKEKKPLNRKLFVDAY